MQTSPFGCTPVLISVACKHVHVFLLFFWVGSHKCDSNKHCMSNLSVCSAEMTHILLTTAPASVSHYCT